MDRLYSSITVLFIIPVIIFYIFKILRREGINKLHQSPKGTMAQKWLRTSDPDDIPLLTSYLYIYLVIFYFHYKSYHNLKLLYLFICLYTFHSYIYVLHWNVNSIRAVTVSFLLCTLEPRIVPDISRAFNKYVVNQ